MSFILKDEDGRYFTGEWCEDGISSVWDEDIRKAKKYTRSVAEQTAGLMYRPERIRAVQLIPTKEKKEI